MDGPSRFIQKVSIRNFLAYKELDVEGFDPNINLIIGTNGSGKTFFKSIEFALTTNIRYTSQLFNKLANDQEIKELSVSVQLANEYAFTRKLLPLTENYLIDEKPVNAAMYHHLIKYYFLNSSLLIPQGKIHQLVASSDRLAAELARFSVFMNNVNGLRAFIQQLLAKFDSTNEYRAKLFSDLQATQKDQLVAERISHIRPEMKLDGTCEFVALDLLKNKMVPLDNESQIYQSLLKYIGYYEHSANRIQFFTTTSSRIHLTECEPEAKKMNDLPELPFEKVLSYLRLEDRLRSKAVSRRWYHKINCFRVKSLCYSTRSRDFICGKNRWVSGVFTQNFISTSRFTSFFNTFGQTIISSLKHLRICDLRLSKEEDYPAFVRTLNSFDQLTNLDLIRFSLQTQSSVGLHLELNLLMLADIQLEEVYGIHKLTLDTPKLKKIRLLGGSEYQKLVVVHSESVEYLLVYHLTSTEVNSLKNLKCLYAHGFSMFGARILANGVLDKLEEIHAFDYSDVLELFEQKREHERADLKIYYWGLLTNGPEDPTIAQFNYLPSSEVTFAELAKHPSRLAVEIPFCDFLFYSTVQQISLELSINVIEKLSALHILIISRPVEDIQPFLLFLKNSKCIVSLVFRSDQPQELFDQLPDHCNVIQRLSITSEHHLDLNFILYLEHLNYLDVSHLVNTSFIENVFNRLEFIQEFGFTFVNTLKLDGRIVSDSTGMKAATAFTDSELESFSSVTDVIKEINRLKHLYGHHDEPEDNAEDYFY